MDKPELSVISKYLSELEEVKTNHSAGLKRVLLAGNESASQLTQVAYGKLPAHQRIESHCHESMEELYFFLAGEGVFIVENETYLLKKDVFIKIPCKHFHSLENTGNTELEFFYFSVALT